MRVAEMVWWHANGMKCSMTLQSLATLPNPAYSKVRKEVWPRCREHSTCHMKWI